MDSLPNLSIAYSQIIMFGLIELVRRVVSLYYFVSGIFYVFIVW